MFEDVTQTVFGHGKPEAPLMLVGEQPGDYEDQQGLLFVGPAGRLLMQALHHAEIDPALPPPLEVEPEPRLMATIHPSSLLRDRSERRQENYALFVEDLRMARAGVASMFRENQPG